MSGHDSDVRILLLDVGILVAMPVFLLGLHVFLPDRLYDHLVFYYHNPRVLTAWTSAFLHGSNSHLYSNLIGYAFAILPTYYLYAYWERRRDFWVTVCVLMLITPFLTALVDYGVLHHYWKVVTEGTNSKGFSGIVSAFGGMLLATIALFLADEYNPITAWYATLIVILGGLSVLTYTTGVLSPTVAGLLFIGVTATGTRFVSLDELRNPRQLSKGLQENWRNVAYIGYCGLVVSIFMALIFPVNVTQNGSFVNVIAHATGFVAGIGGTLIISR